MALTDPGLVSVLDELVDDGRLVHIEYLAPRAERTAPLESPLPLHISDRLEHPALWSHQATAIDRIRRGESTVIATGTASGKSLCYQLPIAEAVADPIRPATALALFPTKALAHDQLRAITDFDFPDLVAAAYDGDTSPEERTWVRKNANLVLTNPEMLHAGLLPHHGRWATFFRRLRFVVVDELHVLRGIFGTHVAHLLRRLRRICADYGSEPTFVFCSATIGHPDDLAADLCGLPVARVDDDGSPRGPISFALLNPPVVDPASGARTSATAEVGSVVARLVESGHRTIAFCRSRKGTELVAADVARRLGPDGRDVVRSYRSGYLASERRQIEDELASGTVRAVVATTALELGVDIGGLDACVLNGFPGTIASMWQQAGRAGRQQQETVVVLVGGEDQLDQWYMANPQQMFTRPPERAVINPQNPFILDPHLACAAFETPLTRDDYRFWSDELDDGVRRLVLADELRTRPTPTTPMAVWAGRGWPSRGVSLRSGSSGEFRIASADGTLVGTVDQSRAFSVVHPGAVYLHRGEAFAVIDLDLDDRAATVERCDGAEYTQARSNVEISVESMDASKPVGAGRLHLGQVDVTTTVTGYQRREVRTRKIVTNETLDLPPQRLVTRAFWYTVRADVLDAAGLAPVLVPGALHAAEHAAIGILPLFTICDRWDVGGVSTALHADTGEATIFVYDGYPGGAGIAELGYEAADRHLRAALEVIRACDCDAGCPSCVQSPKCGNGNEPLEKAGAASLLAEILRSAPSPLH